MMIANTPQAEGLFTRGMDEFVADASAADELVRWYMEVFNEKGPAEWGESWTEGTARRKLFEEPADTSSRSFITTWRHDGELAGVAIACTGKLEDVFFMYDLPPHLKDGKSFDAVKDRVEWIAGPHAGVTFFRELGIVKRHRGGLKPVLDLFWVPCVESLVRGGTFLFFWTGKHSPLYGLMRGLGAQMLLDFRDDRRTVLIGEDIATAIRRVGSPEKEVMRQLATFSGVSGS